MNTNPEKFPLPTKVLDAYEHYLAHVIKHLEDVKASLRQELGANVSMAEDLLCSFEILENICNDLGLRVQQQISQMAVTTQFESLKEARKNHIN